MDSQKVQIVKMLTGFLTALACLAALAFEKKLGADFGETGRLALFALVAGGGLIGGNGALLFQPKQPPAGGGQ